MRPSPRPARRTSPALCLGVLLGALAAALPGCRHRTTSTVLTRTTTRPALRGADRGLELWSWSVSDPRLQPPSDPNSSAPRLLVRDDKTDIESLLAPYLGRPVPMTDAARERWRASGFRIVAVPAADLPHLLDASRLIGTVQRQWLGESPKWADAVAGVRLGEVRPVALPDGTMELEPGRLRLLVRAWTVPVDRTEGPPAAGLHLELTPCLDPVVARRDRMMAVASGQEQPGSRPFATLGTSMTATTDDALVIVPDAPDADWARPAPQEHEDAYGPQTPRVPTLGELMLSNPGSLNTVRTRSIIALVPRIPERYELLPP